MSTPNDPIDETIDNTSKEDTMTETTESKETTMNWFQTMVQKVKEAFVWIGRGVLSLLQGGVNSVIKDVRYVFSTISGLNPSIRIGIVAAILILVALFHAPIAVMLKLQKMAGFLMTIAMFILFLGYVFFMLRISSDGMDVADVAHDTIQEYKKSMGENIAHSIGTTVSNTVALPLDTTQMLGDGS